MNVKFDAKRTGEKIRYYREQRGWSQGNLAGAIKDTHIDAYVIDCYEAGIALVLVETIVAIANALNVEPSWLLVWSDAEMEILEECPHCGKESKYEITKEKLLKKRGRLKCQGCGTKILMCSECTGEHCADQPKCFELREG